MKLSRMDFSIKNLSYSFCIGARWIKVPFLKKKGYATIKISRQQSSKSPITNTLIQKYVFIMKNKIFFYFFSLILILFSCSKIDKCTEAQYEKEINNGNTDPSALIVELNDNGVIGTFEAAYKSGCTGVGNGDAKKGNTLNTTVEITVFTASLVGGNVVTDPASFFNKVFKNQKFVSTFNGTKSSKYDIEVPETGAYAIEYVITSTDCNQCCNGGAKGQCGFSTESQMCKEGKPKIRLLKLYLSNTRPAINQNVEPVSTSDGWGTKSCEDCDTCPEKKCY